MENEKIKCQSCGADLHSGLCGTNRDGSENGDYCKFCFKNGNYSEPSITLKEMIDRSTDRIKLELGKNAAEASELARDAITALKRWQNRGII